MWYYRIEDDNRKYGNIKYARKAAIDSFAYWNDMGVKNPVIRIYMGNMVGEVEIGKVMKGPGYPIYVSKEGTYRLSRSGDARKIQKNPHPFGL